MSKYIIEIEDEPFVKLSALFGKEGLYRAKGFKSLVFDQFGLDKLTPLDKALDEAYLQGKHDAEQDLARAAYDETYQRGLNDAWEAIIKITSIPYVQRSEIFDKAQDVLCIAQKFSPSEVIAKLKAYEERQKADEIKVGDIITDGKINYLVIDITDKSYIALQGTDFEPAYIGKDYIKSYHNLHDSKDMRKITEEINKAMKGEQRDCHTCKHKVASSIECVDCRSFGKWEPKGDAE